MLSKFKKFKKELLLVAFTALVTTILVSALKKPELRISYPQTVQLPSDFKSLTCEEVSETYMRAWSEGSNLLGDSAAKVHLSLSEEKLREWKSSYKDQDGNWVDDSKVKKATVRLDFKDNKVTFKGDNLWYLDNRPFDVTLNNHYRLAGSIVTSKEEPPRYDVAGTFMLDRKTSLLILSDTDTMLSSNESFGSRSRLFTCRGSN